MSAAQVFWKHCGKGEIARNKQFFLFPHCFLPSWSTFYHFHTIWNCRLQTLSVWKSLKFVIWERFNANVFWHTARYITDTSFIKIPSFSQTWDKLKQCLGKYPYNYLFIHINSFIFLSLHPNGPVSMNLQCLTNKVRNKETNEYMYGRNIKSRTGFESGTPGRKASTITTELKGILSKVVLRYCIQIRKQPCLKEWSLITSALEISLFPLYEPCL